MSLGGACTVTGQMIGDDFARFRLFKHYSPVPLFVLAETVGGESFQAWGAEPMTMRQGLRMEGVVREVGTRAAFPGVEVELRAASYTDQTRRTTTTNSTGRFIFLDLAPGAYELRLRDSHTPRDQRVRAWIEQLPHEGPDIELWLEPRRTVSGSVVHASGAPVAAVEVSMVEAGYFNGTTRVFYDSLAGGTTETMADGSFSVTAAARRYYLRASSADGPLAISYYYPGVPFAEDAVPLDLRTAASFPGFDVTFREVTAFEVRVSIRDPLVPLDWTENNPLDAHIRPIGRGRIHETRQQAIIEQTDVETWSIPGLPPGQYELFLEYSRQIQQSFPELDWTRLNPISKEYFVVEDGPVDLEVIARNANSDFPGVVSSTDGSRFAAPDLRVVLQDTDYLLARQSSVRSDGAFDLEGVPPGLYSVGVFGLLQGWYVRSIVSGGRDLLREGLAAAGYGSPISIVVSDDAATVDGIARSANGDPLRNARVVLIPVRNRRGPLLRFPTAAADVYGLFTVANVPPGEYSVLALDAAGRSVRLPYWEDPGFLNEYERFSERIRLDPRSSSTLDVEAVVL